MKPFVLSCMALWLGVALAGCGGVTVLMDMKRVEGATVQVPDGAAEGGAVAAGPADWPNWRGPGYDGKSGVQTMKGEWPAGLTRRWAVDFLCQGKTSNTWGAPVVRGRHVVVMGRNETQDQVFCIDAETGKLIWSEAYEAATAKNFGTGSRATPFIDADRVYTFGRNGDLVCWQLADGRKLWHASVTARGATPPKWGCSSSPYCDAKRVYVQAGGTTIAMAFDKMTGAHAWSSPVADAGGYAAIVPSPQGLLVFHATALSCLNPVSGEAVWTVPWKTSWGVNATTPLAADGKVFITSANKRGAQVLAADGAGVTPRWEGKVFAAQHTDPVLIDGFLYGYTGHSHKNAGRFKCVEFETGRERWSTDRMGWGTTTMVAGLLVCMDIEGNLFAVRPNPKTFELVDSYPRALGEPSTAAWTVPVAANGALYLRHHQHLICYDLR